MTGISVAILAGCQSKKTATSTNTVSTNSAASSSTDNTSAKNSENKSNSDEMKKQIQTAVQSLVTAGTIKQEQADKIVTALTPANAPEGSQGNNQQSSKPNIKPSNDQNKEQKQGNSPLSKLVSDGTINQAQADAVMQKIGNNLPGKGGQNQPSNNGQTTAPSK